MGSREVTQEEADTALCGNVAASHVLTLLIGEDGVGKRIGGQLAHHGGRPAGQSPDEKAFVIVDHRDDAAEPGRQRMRAVDDGNRGLVFQGAIIRPGCWAGKT